MLLSLWYKALRNFYSRPCGRGDPRALGRASAAKYFYSRPCGRGDSALFCSRQIPFYFYSRPCGRGDRNERSWSMSTIIISTHAPAGGATDGDHADTLGDVISTHAPAGGATDMMRDADDDKTRISTHAPAGGATYNTPLYCSRSSFLLTPLREGRRRLPEIMREMQRFLLTPLREGRRPSYAVFRSLISYFYSRPCGRGDPPTDSLKAPEMPFLLTPLREGRHDVPDAKTETEKFLLTPLREGRLLYRNHLRLDIRLFLLTPLREGRPTLVLILERNVLISTHAPAGGATIISGQPGLGKTFLLTPLREGRPPRGGKSNPLSPYFYSRPCGRGDSNFPQVRHEVLRQIAER